jgi:hypothetical protein
VAAADAAIRQHRQLERHADRLAAASPVINIIDPE